MFGKKVLVWVIIVVLVGGLFAGCSQETDGKETTSAKKIEINIGHESNVQTPCHKALLEFEKSVEEKSDGRIDIKIFPASQLGKAMDMMEQVRRGDIQMSLGATTLFTQTIPEFAVWDSFYLFDDEAHAHRVLDGKAGKELLKPLEPMGLTGLGYMEIGFRNFSNSKQPIKTAEDVQGIKIRGYNPIQIKAWEAAGATLTNLSWTEVFTSLQQNLIDGQECATTSFYTAKFYEAQKYWSLTKHIYTNYLWYANTKFMDSLSDEDRGLIEEEIEAAIKLERDLMKKQEEETLAQLPDLGIEVNEVPLEERKKMAELMNAAVKEDIISKCGQEIYNMVMKEVEAERK
ncbi:TRAP transporter substrate-binding protein [Maledivibacter halophilus]|uniref:Tripartite ATP-independent transporter solute receptor, DctP family n=1 Tax=Maledivibacter halophilus TaxID=36842 RepID=A0A1T5IBI0_9FIRM|nr:TRAP transporter substrate-binding protein [Maledivibacter halophilus]SKC36342.1 tripartite ATP-independent transporter solute receptor, DctP family [Maledivibacter halophilus]